MTDIYTPSNRINIVIDATGLTAIMKCSRYYDLQFNNNFQPLKGKGNSLEVGSIIHKFMEVYYGHQIKGISRSQSFGFAISAAELYIQGCPDCTNFVITDETPKPKCNHQINEYPGLQNTPADSEG